MVLHCILLCRAPTNDIQSHSSKLLGSTRVLRVQHKEFENRVPVTGIHLRDTGSLLERVPVLVKHDWGTKYSAAAVFLWKLPYVT